MACFFVLNLWCIGDIQTSFSSKFARLDVNRKANYDQYQLTVICFTRKLNYGSMAKKGKVPKVEVLRKEAEVTQEQLSNALGITDHTYRNWIKGRSEPTMTVRQMKTLCELLKCELKDLPDDFTQLSESD